MESRGSRDGGSSGLIMREVILHAFCKLKNAILVPTHLRLYVNFVRNCKELTAKNLKFFAFLAIV